MAIAIGVLCLFEALCFFWSGWWFVSVMRGAGATLSQMFAAAQGEWTIGLLFLVAGVVHWMQPRTRLPLATLGVLGGFYAVYFMTRSSNLLGSWNVLHGDIVAVSVWSEAILLGLGVACAVELAILVRSDGARVNR